MPLSQNGQTGTSSRVARIQRGTKCSLLRVVCRPSSHHASLILLVVPIDDHPSLVAVPRGRRPPLCPNTPFLAAICATPQHKPTLPSACGVASHIFSLLTPFHPCETSILIYHWLRHFSLNIISPVDNFAEAHSLVEPAGCYLNSPATLYINVLCRRTLQPVSLAAPHCLSIPPILSACVSSLSP